MAKLSEIKTNTLKVFSRLLHKSNNVDFIRPFIDSTTGMCYNWTNELLLYIYSIQVCTKIEQLIYEKVRTQILTYSSDRSRDSQLIKKQWWGGKRWIFLTGDLHVSVMSSVVEKLWLVGRTHTHTRTQKKNTRTVERNIKSSCQLWPLTNRAKARLLQHIYRKRHWCGKHRCRDCKKRTQRIWTT